VKRSIDDVLLNWKDDLDRKPLILRGARQVGKTYSVKAFGSSQFQETLTVDFERLPQLRSLFEPDLDVHRIVEMLELEFKTSVAPGKTLLFFDEVQHCPRALATLRYFFEDLPQLHVVAAGSMLEFQMGKISFPVGRVESTFMYPLTFEEFLLNTGNEKLNEYRPCLDAAEPVPEFAHHKLMEEMKRFFVVGGMPEAVAKYRRDQSLRNVEKAHKSLYDSYVQDLLKYEKNLGFDAITAILDAIPRQVGSQIKYSLLCEGRSVYKVKTSLHALEKALLVHPVRSSNAGGLPLGGEINRSVIKAVFLDIGLLQYIRGIPAISVLSAENLLDAYHGALCEQFVGQELVAAGGSQNGALYYWSRAAKNSSAEVDYLRVKNGIIFPIEIKKGPTGRLRSLHLLLKGHQNIPYGYVLNTGNVGTVGRIHFRPLYTLF